MLKIEVDKGVTKVTAGGDLREVIADFAIAIHHVFNALQQDQTGAAAAVFKACMQSVIMNPNSGVFDITGVVGEGMAMILPVADKE